MYFFEMKKFKKVLFVVFGSDVIFFVVFRLSTIDKSKGVNKNCIKQTMLIKNKYIKNNVPRFPIDLVWNDNKTK
jgi:hypothetical protein